MTNKALAKLGTVNMMTAFQPQTFEQLLERAEVIVKSGILPSHIRTKEQFVAIAMMGRELGLSDMESTRSIYVIKGVPTVKPQTMLALIRRSKIARYTFKRVAGVSCTCVITRLDTKEVYEYTFGKKEADTMISVEDNKTIPLSQKFNYRTMPDTMYQWRAVGGCARIAVPELIGGFYLPEEIDPNVEIENPGKLDEEYRVDDVVTHSHPDLLSNITGDGGKPLKISDVPDDRLGDIIVPTKEKGWVGNSIKTLFLHTAESLRFLKDQAEHHPIREIQDAIRRFLELNDPNHGADVIPAATLAPTASTDEKGALPVTTKPATIAQKKAIAKLADAAQLDLLGYLHAWGDEFSDLEKLTYDQAAQVIKEGQKAGKK